MKILTFVKMSSIVAVGAGVISSAVVFSNINSVATPYVKVLTKENYLKIKESQNNNQALLIDYQGLPTSDLSVSDLLRKNNVNHLDGFIFTVGSQAYSETNKILNGVDASYGQSSPYEVNSSALMLKLYDLFYNDQSANHLAVKDLNVNFFSFIDIVNTKQVVDSANLLQYRRTGFPDANGNPAANVVKPQSNNGDVNQYPAGASWLWEVQVPDETTKEQRPIVKSSSGNSNEILFNYEPDANYYEFLPNNDYDTKYEKVYFRDQKDVALFNNTINWMNSYCSSYLSNISFNKQGSIIAAKKVDNTWSFSVFSSSSSIDDFIKFYNPDYDLENGDSSSDNA